MKASFTEKNIVYSKVLNEKIKYTNISEKQYEKYKIIHQNAKFSVHVEKKLLDGIREYEENMLKEQTKRLDLKKISYKEAEDKLDLVKQSIIDADNKLAEISLEIKDRRIQIRERNIKIEKLSDDYTIKLRDYLRENKLLYEIYRDLDAKDINSIISYFKENQIQFNGEYSIVSLIVK